MSHSLPSLFALAQRSGRPMSDRLGAGGVGNNHGFFGDAYVLSGSDYTPITQTTTNGVFRLDVAFPSPFPPRMFRGSGLYGWDWGR
jgi:hypothetical protein